MRHLNCSGQEDSIEQCVVPPWGEATPSCMPQSALCYNSSESIIDLDVSVHFEMLRFVHRVICFRTAMIGVKLTGAILKAELGVTSEREREVESVCVFCKFFANLFML